MAEEEAERNRDAPETVGKWLAEKEAEKKRLAEEVENKRSGSVSPRRRRENSC